MSVQTIFKQEVGVGVNRLAVSRGSKFLAFGVEQDGQLVVWYLVPDAHDLLEEQVVHVVGTGWILGPDTDLEVTSMTQYIGTVQQGRYVWHAFTNLKEEIENGNS